MNKEEKQQQETDEERAKYGLGSTKESDGRTVQREFGAGDTGNMGGMAQFNLPSAKLKSALEEDGEYIIISRKFQGEDPVIMSSGDQEQTRQLFEQVTRTYAWQELTPA